MSGSTQGAGLRWLPRDAGLGERLRATEEGGAGWGELRALAGVRMDLPATGRLDRLLRRLVPEAPEGVQAVRVAVLGSCTLSHLVAPLRVAALRRGMHVVVHEGGFGQHAQELLGPDPALRAFGADAVVLSLDARHLSAGLAVGATAGEAEALLRARVEELRRLWARARGLGAGIVIQQAALPVPPPLMGGAEEALPGSALGFLERLNALLREAARAEGVQVLAVDRFAARDGLRHWHDPVRWHHAKQEVSGRAALLWGDLAARTLGALLGRSAKVLVLDLDDTIWGGTVGEEGAGALVLGEGSALGEGFAAVQAYARDLARRGVVLAVCSKNDEAVARAAFGGHPGMVLRPEDVACFVANWEDKAGNLRRIARELSLGPESLVFLDDNPAERALVRAALPEVWVPEPEGDDPAEVPELLAEAGYFEAVSLTAEDLARTGQYRARAAAAAAREEATDLPGFLRGLEMRLHWSRVDEAGLPRAVQLTNKTNQFNLLTRRETAEGMRARMADPRASVLQMRLVDRLGDHGVVAIAAGRVEGEAFEITDWLMSCRVLGRGVERATLRLLTGEARRLGATRLRGRYRATERNGMVAGLLASLGFVPEGDGWEALELGAVPDAELFMELREG